jgi:hypothetical protein
MQNPRGMHTYLVTTGPAKHRMAAGIGCNFLISHQGALPGLNEKKKWQQIMDALDDLQMGWMRMGVVPSTSGWNPDSAWDDKAQAWRFDLHLLHTPNQHFR